MSVVKSALLPALLGLAVLIASVPRPDVSQTSDLVPAAYAQASLPALPSGWPSTTLQLGKADQPGGAGTMKGTAPFGFRYQYLAGGVNTGDGWATWNTNGAFVSMYVDESRAAGMTPVFTYYMLLQSLPASGSDEQEQILGNLKNTSTMKAYYADLTLFFQRAAADKKPVVLHVEPDLWGYIQQAARSDDASTVGASVASSGVAELSGLPNTAAGFAQAVVRLRDKYAPNVILGYHVSTWGTGIDIAISDPSNAEVDQLGARAATLYRSLGARYDVTFAEFSDRDSGFKQAQYGQGSEAWWDAGDFGRHVRFLGAFARSVQTRLVLWQIPYGNTKMRAVNNTWNHYQDNRVEWLLDDASRAHLQAYVDIGAIAFLFGRGAGGATNASDANNDGVTNPAPINGNTRTSINADDDGGFFGEKAKAYYAAGPMKLSAGSGTQPTATPTSSAPTPTATATSSVPTPPATATPSATAPTTQGYTVKSTVSPSTVAPGQSTKVSAVVTSGAASSALVDLEVYDPSGAKVGQQFFDNQSFSAGQSRTYSMTWAAPSGAATGTYTVKVGIFSPGWNALYDWEDSAVTFKVSTSTAPATPAPTKAPATPTKAPATPTKAPATATPTSGSTGALTVKFDDYSDQEVPLTGQYPSAVVNWGSSGSWWLSAPWGKLTTKSLTYTGSAKSATFTLPTPRKLVSLRAYNGWSDASTVTLSCPGQPTKTASVGGQSVVTITTGWTGTCSSVTISSSNGNATNFDDLTFDK